MGFTLTERDYVGITFAIIVALGVSYLCWKVWVKENERKAVIARAGGEGQRIEMRDLERGEKPVLMVGGPTETRNSGSGERVQHENWIGKWIKK